MATRHMKRINKSARKDWNHLVGATCEFVVECEGKSREDAQRFFETCKKILEIFRSTVEKHSDMSDEFRRNLKEVRFSCHSDMKENIFAEISRSGVCRVLVGADASGAEACLVAAFALYKQTGSSKKTWKRIVRTDHNPSNSAEAKDEEVRETFVLPPAEFDQQLQSVLFCVPKEMLAKILSYLGPKHRIAFLQTSKKSLDFALSYVWCPWADDARGLVFACSRGFNQYYKKWMAVSYSLKQSWRLIATEFEPVY